MRLPVPRGIVNGAFERLVNDVTTLFKNELARGIEEECARVSPVYPVTSANF